MNTASSSAPKKAENILSMIGNTALVRLQGPSELTGCNIYAKCEFTNPGGSIKDRAALSIIEDAEAQGLIAPGGVIVEGTTGNTGIGLTLVGAAKGYHTIIVMPETQSQEKIASLQALGAELVLVPETSYSNSAHYVHMSRRLAQETDNAIWANQFDNLANRMAHIKTTSQEIWAQTDGQIDGFVCAAGTGGTFAGTGLGLKEHNADIVVALADPYGAALYNYYTSGELRAEGHSIAEGIGQSRITANLDGAPVDAQFLISDQEGLTQIYQLLQKEGLSVGLSSGINIAGAMKLAKTLGPGKTIVTILADSGLRYLSTLYNHHWLIAHDLPVPEWLAK
ncbi:MAG: cysteine synthase A [Zymomonas mobilis]|uniref:Cysteine synthase A n=1 Tax=Zymomonas mobilis TaxID=542 RepID=A0A542W0Y9_ZYMMB|nr:cysteine synthase A [Zymomonas mobilis]TQL17245.1 cysteine synthase A [Zymomonas mobilis]